MTLTARIEAGLYEITTDRETYRVQKEGGRRDGVPIYWNIFARDGECIDATNTLKDAKWLIARWELNQEG